MTINEILKAWQAVNPLPNNVIENICEEMGVDPYADGRTIDHKTLTRLKAEVYIFLSELPHVMKQGGVKLEYKGSQWQKKGTGNQKAYYRQRAQELLLSIGEGKDEEIHLGEDW